ncbi:UNVERIFIED_CONTAM: Alpha-scruin [Trichonephila clavipes]
MIITTYRKLLGLRKVEHLPTFARDMLTVTNLQDDSLPVILVMGGLQPKEPVNLSYGKLIMRYSPLKDRWEYFGVLPEPRNYHAAVYYREFIYVTGKKNNFVLIFLRNRIYLLVYIKHCLTYWLKMFHSGGCDPDKRNCGEMVATNTTYCLNIHSSEWIQKAEMLCTRSHHCLVALQGKLYAIGGRDHNGRLKRQFLFSRPLKCLRIYCQRSLAGTYSNVMFSEIGAWFVYKTIKVHTDNEMMFKKARTINTVTIVVAPLMQQKKSVCL